MDAFIQQLKDFYAGLEPAQQKMFLAATIGCAVLLVGVGVWAQGETWRPVVSGSSDEVRRAAGALSAEQISYRITNDGTSLEVIEASVGAAHMAVAADGLRPDGVGEVDLPIGLPPAMQARVLREMLQNELAHMVRQIEVVDYAWVSITEASNGTYLTDDTEARASIVVALQDGSTITERQVRSIVNLTSMAVKDLDPGRISLTDQDGNVLHSPDGDGVTAGGSELLTLQLERELAITNKVESALTDIFGTTSAATVTVALELDHDEQTVVHSDVDPDRMAALDETSSETSQMRGSARGAVRAGGHGGAEQAARRHGPLAGGLDQGKEERGNCCCRGCYGYIRGQR